ncbi:hypothetical protein OB955_13205 [Halobacteria archaeon AArc-m2/3/4]|uniref:Uncharacterized protein n=1 Tax=Natronoglomus mannanivorans TaxID=2979990 RepID=A0ABT2QFI9_9EURY|nr:hypothetical protein [Halobacteria archaeon AArc-m2/3/4]
MNRRWAALAVGCIVVVLVFVRSAVSRRVDVDADDIPFCPLFARGRIGADWASRRGFEGDSALGELDDFAVYDRDGFDSSAVHPEIRRFYERTTEYDLVYETHWHRGFRAGAWLAAFVTSRLEQLNLPGRNGRVRRLESEIAGVVPTADPRGSRVWTRTDPDRGHAVFVAVYATHDRDGVTYANVAVPLPWSNLSTVLRPERMSSSADVDRRFHIGADSDSDLDIDTDVDGVEFTTRDPGPGDGGLYLVTPLGAFRLPMAQSFRVWPPNAFGSPTAPTATTIDPTLVATHEMWLFGQQFLTIRYGIDRSVVE